jgi:hypothetical protein
MFTKNFVLMLLIIASLLCVPKAASANSYHAIVNFKDGKTLSGKLLQMTSTAVGIDPDGPVSYRMIAAEEIASVYVKELDRTFTFPISPEEIPPAFSQQRRSAVAPGFLPAPSGLWGFGFTYGYAAGLAEYAIDGFESTEFGGGEHFGASLFYKFRSGLAFELNVSRFAMPLREGEVELGRLRLSPVLLLIKYQTKPYRAPGVAYHMEIGGGAYSAAFQKGNFIKEVESYGAQFTIETENAFVLELGGGVDYFFSPKVSLLLDGRMLLGNIGTNWRVSGPLATVPLNGVEKFLPSNFQILAGLRIWLPAQ